MAEQKRGGPRGHGPQGHGFQRPKDFRGTVSKLLRYIGRYKAALVVVFICLVISSVGSVMSSYLLKPIINDDILVGDFAGLLKMLALLLGLFLLSGLCSYAYARIMVHISQRTVAQMRQDLFDKLQDLPLRYFDTHQSGDLMSRFTNDMDTVSEMINSSFASVVSCALTFIGIVVMMLYMNWVLTLITFAFLVLMLLVVKGVGGRSRVSFQAQQQALGAMNGYIEEMVEGQKVIKVFNHESKAIAQFSGLNDSYRDAATAAQTYSGAMMPAMANLSRIDYAVTCCVGGLLAIGGMFDVGSLGAYLLYVKQVSQPISQISQQVNVLLAAVAGAERIFAVMEAEPEVDEGKTVIVRVEKHGDTLTETDRRTGCWAWKKPDGTLVELKGDAYGGHQLSDAQNTLERRRRVHLSPRLCTVVSYLTDLSVELGGAVFKNPVMPASGTYDYFENNADCFPVSELGAVMIKSVHRLRRPGNPGPRIAEVCGGMLNCVVLEAGGYRGPAGVRAGAVLPEVLLLPVHRPDGRRAGPDGARGGGAAVPPAAKPAPTAGR